MNTDRKHQRGHLALFPHLFFCGLFCQTDQAFHWVISPKLDPSLYLSLPLPFVDEFAYLNNKYILAIGRIKVNKKLKNIKKKLTKVNSIDILIRL